MQDKIVKEFITFLLAPLPGKAKFYEVRSNAADFLLGNIKFNGAWKSYAFYPEEKMYFTAEVLDDITSFLKDLEKEYLASKELNK